MTEILVEKYRPKKIEDVIGLKFNVRIDQNIPHLLLCGTQGSGKTSLAKIIIRELEADSLTINASDERGIDVIREKVKQFASTMSTNGKIKIVFLDESDFLTIESQTALRNTMETYSGNCRFIMTANFASKIIEPLQSRCVVINFGDTIEKSDVVDRLKYICDAESIKYEMDALNSIAEYYGGDIRSAINKLDELRYVGVYLSNIIQENDNLAEEIFKCLLAGVFDEARQIYLDAKPKPIEEQFLRDFYIVIMNSKCSNVIKYRAIHEIANCYRFLNQVAWKNILIEDMFLKITEVI